MKNSKKISHFWIEFHFRFKMQKQNRVLFVLPFLFFLIHCTSSKKITATPQSENFQTVPNKKNGCVDLVFDTVRVIKITEKFIELEFVIRNNGNIPAPIFGTTHTLEDHVAVHFFFSGTPRLTRGAILADGIYLTEGLKNTKGLMYPQTTYIVRHKLSLKKKNQFSGVIILQLDAFDIIPNECDETNNVKAIVPKWF